VLLAMAAYRDLEVRQLDVINAYTCSDLHATVYMRLPDGLKCPEGKALHVKKSLYGLKQSGREWYIEASYHKNELRITKNNLLCSVSSKIQEKRPLFMPIIYGLAL
jgi:hypothetical protein